MPDRWTGEGGPRRHEPSASPDLSIVVPIYNEAENMDRFFARLDAVLDDMDVPAEVVCVDDGSSDASWDRLLEHGARDSRLRLVRLSRNFGKVVALACGLAHTAGRAVVPIDADLQHPPEVIAEFFAAWRAGYDMVYGIRRSRAESRGRGGFGPLGRYEP